MKLKSSYLRQAAKFVAVCCVAAAPLTTSAADRVGSTPRVAPLGVPVQQVNYASSNNYYAGNGSCPNGDCATTGVQTWNGSGVGGRWWGNGACSSCGLFGCGGGCQHGLAQGNAWVRPPAVWPLARSSNTYQHYWAPQLVGAEVPPVAYPMIYHPTDTTQLGFGYRHVPRWGYRPDMLPPAPVPYWPMGAGAVYGGGFGYGAAGYGGDVVYSAAAPNNGAIAQGPVPSNSPVTPAQPRTAVAQPRSNVPPPPAEPEAAVFPNRARQ